MVRGLLLVLCATACGGGATRPGVPLDLYRPGYRGDITLSASGRTAAIALWHVGVEEDELRVELVERTGRNHQISAGRGRIVGQPTDRDVLLLTRDRRLTWMRRKGEVAMPRASRLDYLGGVADHRRHTAVLVFGPLLAAPAEESEAARRRRTATLTLVEVDTRAMAVRGSRPVAADAGDCQVAAGPPLFVTCRAAGGPADRERLIVSRYDRLQRTLRATVDLSPDRRSGFMSCVAGDGSALVISYGNDRRGWIDPRSAAIVDAASGRVRVVPEDSRLLTLSRMVPMPGRPAVARMHESPGGGYFMTTSGAFNGISVIDTRVGAIRTVLDTWDVATDLAVRHRPSSLAVAPDGTFVLGVDKRR